MSCVYLPYREQTSQVRPQTAPPTWPVQNQTRSRLCSNNSESPRQPLWLAGVLRHCSTFLFPPPFTFPISHPYLLSYVLLSHLELCYFTLFLTTTLHLSPYLVLFVNSYYISLIFSITIIPSLPPSFLSLTISPPSLPSFPSLSPPIYYSYVHEVVVRASLVTPTSTVTRNLVTSLQLVYTSSQHTV